jgi:hypothetical protein
MLQTAMGTAATEKHLFCTEVKAYAENSEYIDGKA